jgi:hypothetical protein
MKHVYHKKRAKYHVTGVTVRGKRFKYVYSHPMMAMSVNLYRGSVWQVVEGKRTLVKRVFN